MKKLLVLALLIPSLAFAAEEDELMPKRASAQPMLCVNNEDLANRSTTQGDAQYVACDDKGRPIVRLSTTDVELTTTPVKAGTSTLSNVSDTASSTTLLAANTSRLGASIQNDSTAILYVKFGTTASTSSFTVKMDAGDYYEVPFGYSGRIDGIWASDASGAARMTELEP
jgi:hypothetical protein